MKALGAAALLLLGAACGPATAPPPPPPIVAPPPGLAVLGVGTIWRDGDALPPTSPFFDGERVRVRLVRGEVVPLQVVVAPSARVRVEAPTGVTVEVAALDAVVVATPSTAMYGGSRGVGRYRDRVVPLTGPTSNALVTLTAGLGAPAGVARGVLVIDERRLPLEVTIEPFVLAPPTAPRAWAYYDPREIASATGAAAGSDAVWAQEQTCAAMFRRHGVMATPELTLDDADRRLPITAGSAFVPVLLPDDEAGVRAAVQGWIDRTHATAQRPFAIPVDEPRDDAARARTRTFAAWIHGASPVRGQFLLAATTEPAPWNAGIVDLYIAPGAVTLAGRPEATPPDGAAPWTYNGRPPAAGSMVVDAAPSALRTWGWIATRWNVPLWYVWDGLYWHDRHNRKLRRPQALPGPPLADVATTSAITFDDGDDRGNLDGALAYPDPTAGCAPSLRLVQLARGFTDAAMLDAVTECGAPAVAAALAAELVPTALGDAPRDGAAAWPSDDAAWEAARGRLLDALAACHAGDTDGP